MQRILTPAVVLLFGGALNAQTIPIYNSIPTPLPPSLTNQSFQAPRVSEFGNLVKFGGTNRHLTSVTVAMVTLGYFSKYNTSSTPNNGSWSHDITLNLYSVDNGGANPAPGTKIGSVTQPFLIPWRPEPNGCPLNQWLASDGCHNGMAFKITFDLSSLQQPLPDQVIFGIAYNTQSAGQAPTGVDGPYNGLNVGLNATNANTVPGASNPLEPQPYVNSSVPGVYADNGAGGVNVFRLDVGNNVPNIAIEFNVPIQSPALITVMGGGTQGATVGTQFGAALQAKVTDAGGNPFPGVPVTFSVPPSGASAMLTATQVMTDSNGVASVTATANAISGAYPVTASVAGVTTPALFNLTNLAGSAQTIAFVQQPTDTQAGRSIRPVVTVSLGDANNNPIVNAAITLSVSGGKAVTGAMANTDATGIATFSGLSIQQAGTYQLQASGGGLTSMPSASFTITAGAALSITPLSGGGQTAGVGTPYPSPLTALVQDGFMNPIPAASVTFAAPPSGASVSFGGSPIVMTDVNGIATSPAMTANGLPGAFPVTASTGPATSATFVLTNVAGAANKLTFIQQPADTAAGAIITPPVTVQLEDSFGNAVKTANIPVTLQVNPVAARMLGPLSFAAQLTDANGLATFTSLSISQVGQYQLLAESSGIASATSNPFNIHAGTASTIMATAGTPQSALVQTVYGEPLQVTVTDTAGIPVSGVPVVFAAPTSGASGLFGGQPTITVNTDAQGHAAPVITANSIAGAFSVTASSTAITGIALFDLTNLPAGSSSLAFGQQPSNAAAGQIIAPPVTVQVIGGSGNAMQVPGIPVYLSLSSGTGALFGTVVQVTDATGLATFNDLKIGTVGT